MDKGRKGISESMWEQKVEFSTPKHMGSPYYSHTTARMNPWEAYHSWGPMCLGVTGRTLDESMDPSGAESMDGHEERSHEQQVYTCNLLPLVHQI